MHINALENIIYKSTAKSILAWFVFLLLTASNYFVFIVTPEEQVMGAVQKVFYFHVGSAIVSYVLIAILFVASVFYLISRRAAWNYLADASSSVGLLFCSIVLITGMIWGKSAWNTWWRWEPRLVSFLVLWAVLFSHRFLSWQRASAVFSAVLGIFAALNVPIVVFSVKFLNQSEQLHPQVVAQQGLRSEWYVFTLLFCTISLIIFAFLLMMLKTKVILLSSKYKELSRNYG